MYSNFLGSQHFMMLQTHLHEFQWDFMCTMQCTIIKQKDDLLLQIKLENCTTEAGEYNVPLPPLLIKSVTVTKIPRFKMTLLCFFFFSLLLQDDGVNYSGLLGKSVCLQSRQAFSHLLLLGKQHCDGSSRCQLESGRVYAQGCVCVCLLRLSVRKDLEQKEAREPVRVLSQERTTQLHQPSVLQPDGLKHPRFLLRKEPHSR